MYRQDENIDKKQNLLELNMVLLGVAYESKRSNGYKTT
jgi:hypothetical protein